VTATRDGTSSRSAGWRSVVRGGQVIGSSDKIAAYPAASPFRPSNLGATINHSLGVDARTMIADRLNRPMHLNKGEVIETLYSGRG